MPVISPDKGGVFGRRSADTAACKTKRRQKPTVNDNHTNPYRLGRRPGQQGPRPLPSNQGRVEKLATGKHADRRHTTGNTQILRPVNKILTVGIGNVQTLWAAGKLELLRNEMKRFKYDIIDVSEVRWTENCDFIWSEEENTHTRGVGLLLGTQARKVFIGYNPISSRVIMAIFDAAPFKLTVIHVYAPTSLSSEEDIEAFYSDIDEALSKTDKKDIIILTGDWNAKVGNDNKDWKSVMGRYGYDDRNERGERLLEFATLHNLYVCNSRFQQKPSRKWTWASPDGIHKNMIDLILIQQRWKTSVINCRTFQSADISSDHFLVLCNIKLQLKRMNNRPQQRCRGDVNQQRDEKVRQSYNVLLEKNMQDIEPTCNLEEHATRLTAAIRSAAETTIPARRTARKPWISEETLKLAEAEADEERLCKMCTTV